jgi:hypothetical protein
MVSMMFQRLGVRIDAIASFARHCDPGAHKALRTYRAGESASQPVHQIVSRYLLSFKDRYPDATRDWREPDESILPKPNEEGHFAAVQRWRFLLCLVAEATQNGRNRLSRRASFGGAMRLARFGDATVNRMLATYPRLHEESTRNIVRRLCAGSGTSRFDLTPLAYGYLYPEAEDIPEIRYTIERDFWIGTFRSEPQTAKEVAEAFEPAAQ